LGTIPSVLRSILAKIPDASAWSFIDIGCGKGRALAVASELPFRKIVGIELSPDLCRIAVRNAEQVRVRHPDRTPIEIVEGDATEPVLPDGPVVVLLYHSFLFEELVAKLAAHLAKNAEKHEILFVYMNPVFGAAVDRNTMFKRWFAKKVPISQEDLPYCRGVTESAVVWHAAPQSGYGLIGALAALDAQNAIIVTEPGLRAEIVER
jgi:SAM-dependent methyltransferase